MTGLSLDELLNRARQSDQQALRSLVEACRYDLLSWARQQSLVEPLDDAEAAKLVQAALIEAVRDFDLFTGSGEADWMTWVRGILQNRIAPSEDSANAEPTNKDSDRTQAYMPASPDAQETRGPQETMALDGQNHLPTQSVELSGPAVRDDQPGPSLPLAFGDYELLEEIGRGGMGVVYKARQVKLERIVALKMILAGKLAAETDIKRFYVEAQAAGRLEHPNIVRIYQVGQWEGQHYFSMDLIEGSDLDRLAGRELLAPQRIGRYLRDIAEAVHFAHEQGILHRDLKPANVLIDEHDRPQITDFGLAKQLKEQSGLTASGAAMGTPSYMPPEQAAGRSERVCPASDVYSLGAILYALLTGRPPFRGESAVQTIMDVMDKEPAAPSDYSPQVDRDLETICLKCLSKNPSDRYRSAADLRDELNRYLASEPIRARPIGPMRRAMRWLGGVPIVAALSGQRLRRATRWQRRAQWLALAGVLVCVLGTIVWRSAPNMVMPREIRIAAAEPGGRYYEFSEALAERIAPLANRPAQAVATRGSVSNLGMLQGKEAELALLQTSTVLSDEVAVVAPLYYDLVLVVVRRTANVETMAQLEGRTVSVGRDGSGMKLTAEELLRFYKLSVESRPVYFQALAEDPDIDAAIVTTSPANADLQELLTNGEFRLLPLNRADELAGPIFSPRIATRGLLRAQDEFAPAVPETDLQTVATTTFLAVQKDAADRLVQSVLKTLYYDSDLVGQFDLFPLEQAAQWKYLDLHPAARNFFDHANSGLGENR